MIEVARKGFRVDGADGSQPMLDEAAEKFRDTAAFRTTFYLCEAANLPVVDKSYSFVYSIRLLNQTESPAYALKVISEIIRVTEPNGYCLIEFMNVWRPRIGKNKRASTRLKPSEVLEISLESGAELVKWEGAFFLGMQAYQKVPKILLYPLTKIDRFLSSIFPRICSRTYILVRRVS